MSKCRYDLSEDCNNTDCLNCVLDDLRAEIKQKIVIRPALNHSRAERDRNDAFLEVLDVINKYRKGE